MRLPTDKTLANLVQTMCILCELVLYLCPPPYHWSLKLTMLHGLFAQMKTCSLVQMSVPFLRVNLYMNKYFNVICFVRSYLQYGDTRSVVTKHRRWILCDRVHKSSLLQKLTHPEDGSDTSRRMGR